MVQLVPETEDCHRTIQLEDSPVELSSFAYNIQLDNCTWKVVTTNPEHGISIDFGKVPAEGDVEIFDGYKDRYMARISSDVSDRKFTTTTTVFTIKLNLRTQYDGFTVTLTPLDRSIIEASKEKCDGNLIASEDKKTLLSPGFPSSFNNSLSCHWLLESDETDAIILFYFEKVNIVDCCSSVKIYDGPGTQYPTLATINRESEAEEYFTSSSNSLYIILETVAQNSQGSFSMNYFRELATVDTCNRRVAVTDVATSLMSDNYPTAYPHQSDCSWELVTSDDQIIELVIEDVDMEECCDFIEISDGKEKLVIRKLSQMGEEKKITIRSSTPIMNVRIFSDRSVGGRGFKAEHQSDQKIFDPQACGYISYVGEGETLEITTPNYPNDYPSNKACNWLLLPSVKGQQVQLKITDARVEDCCDSVEIRNGKSDEAQLIGVINGYVGAPGRTYTSTDGALLITFKSDISGSFRGFHGEYVMNDGTGVSSNLCNRREKVTSSALRVDESSVENCPPESSCVEAVSEEVVVITDRGMADGKLKYSGCIQTSQCQNLTCDFLSSLRFSAHNADIENMGDGCTITCCVGDLCNTVEEAAEEEGCGSLNSVDVMFLMDGSGSQNAAEFQKQKQFVTDVASNFDFLRYNVGVMQYSHWFQMSPLTSAAQTYFETHIPLGQSRNHEEFSTAMQAIELHGYTGYLGHAVEKAIMEDMTKSERFLDPCTKKAIVAITDGKASDPRYLLASHRQAAAFDIHMYAVGIDQFRRVELQLLVNGRRGANENIFVARKFNDLPRVVRRLTAALDEPLETE